MIEVHFGRYEPTLNIHIDDNTKLAYNIFKSILHAQKEYQDLTSAINDSNIWLEDHFGFVLIKHNNILLQRMCNYKKTKEILNSLKVLMKLENYIDNV